MCLAPQAGKGGDYSGSPAAIQFRAYRGYAAGRDLLVPVPPLRPIRSALLAALAIAPTAAAAADRPLCPAPPPLPAVDVAEPGAPGITRAESDSARWQGSTAVLEGNVGVRRDGRSVAADRIRLDRDREQAVASGNVLFTTDEFAVQGTAGEMALDSGAFRIDGARYRQPPLHAQGRAERVRRDADGVSRLDGATWSTCPPQAEAWHIAADYVRLDPAARQGHARHVSLWFKGVPLFYSPWFSFPLGDDRKTGFLPPRIGRSSESGAIVATPWYWNAAPNFDATLTPRWLEDRGTQLQSEWRWLGPAGYWQIDNEHLPDDELTGTDRTFTRVQQRASLAGGWRTRLDASEASDADYFEDLGDDLALSSQTHLLRRADVMWSGAAGRFRGRVESYQTLDESIPPLSRPYERMPQLTFTTGGAVGGLETTLDTELVRFDRADSDTGERLRLVPAVTWPLERPGWFLRPRLAVDHTQYDLERVQTPGPEDPSRTLPIASLDTGLVFDRFGRDYQQTLEPRLFYVHVPAEDQDDIPLFDTGAFDFSFQQMFRERRFTGGDRVGDTDRLTLALTSRVLERTSGRELLRASIGGIRYFDERTVTLRPGDPPDTAERSDLIAELGFNPTPSWSTDASLQWDPDADQSERYSAAVRYRGAGGGVANLGYRFRRDTQEQIDIAGAWPVSPRWDVVARSNYSLRDDQNIESLLGLEYESCCWSVRTVARQYLSGDGTDQASGVYVELVLKGLGSVGDPAGSLLERAILGYSDPTD